MGGWSAPSFGLDDMTRVSVRSIFILFCFFFLIIFKLGVDLTVKLKVLVKFDIEDPILFPY